MYLHWVIPLFTFQTAPCLLCYFFYILLRNLLQLGRIFAYIRHYFMVAFLAGLQIISKLLAFVHLRLTLLNKPFTATLLVHFIGFHLLSSTYI